MSIQVMKKEPIAVIFKLVDKTGYADTTVKPVIVKDNHTTLAQTMLGIINNVGG
jgi:hypothetical protein